MQAPLYHIDTYGSDRLIYFQNMALDAPSMLLILTESHPNGSNLMPAKHYQGTYKSFKLSNYIRYNR